MTTRRRHGLVAAALTGLVFTAALRGDGGPAPEPDKELRGRALALNSVTGTDPQNGQLKLLRANPARTLQMLKLAAKMAKEKDQPFNRNATLLLAQAAEGAREVDLSARFYRLNIEQNAKLLSEKGVATGYVGLATMYANNRRYDDSEKICKEFLSIDLDDEGPVARLKPLMLRRLIFVMARKGQVEKALKLAAQIVQDDPRSFQNLALKAQIEREAEKYEGAAKSYLEAIDLVKKDDDMPQAVRDEFIDDYRYALSGVYVDLKQIDKAIEQLRLLLKRDPDSSTYHNDLGYIMADNGKDLDEAEKLIRKAIELDRAARQKDDPTFKPGLETDNPAYLDSLGWVLFKKGKAKEAKPYLAQAVKDRDGQSLEVFDHLGDVHLALGETKEAVAAWKKGLEAATTSKRDVKRKADVQKKLKKHADE